MSGNIAIRPLSALLICVLLLLASAWATGVLMPGSPAFAASGWGSVGPTVDVNALAVSPAFATDNTVYAGTESNGVYRSTDSGNITWTQVNTGLTDTSVDALAI